MISLVLFWAQFERLEPPPWSPAAEPGSARRCSSRSRLSAADPRLTAPSAGPPLRSPPAAEPSPHVTNVSSRSPAWRFRPSRKPGPAPQLLPGRVHAPEPNQNHQRLTLGPRWAPVPARFWGYRAAGSRVQLRGATCRVHGHPDTSDCVSAAGRSNRSTEAGEPSPQLPLQTGRLCACVRAKSTHFNFTVSSLG